MHQLFSPNQFGFMFFYGVIVANICNGMFILIFICMVISGSNVLTDIPYNSHWEIDWSSNPSKVLTPKWMHCSSHPPVLTTRFPFGKPLGRSSAYIVLFTTDVVDMSKSQLNTILHLSAGIFSVPKATGDMEWFWFSRSFQFCESDGFHFQLQSTPTPYTYPAKVFI